MTVQHFLTILLQDFPSLTASSPEDAIRLGIIEDSDLRALSMPITRRRAARITHEILLRVQKEPDVSDWSSAELLKDLYDCHSCVRHIAQIYAKGILPSIDSEHFGVDLELSEQEAIAIHARLQNIELRVPPKSLTVSGFSTISFTGISKFPRSILIDVRSAKDYEEEPIAFHGRPLPCDNIPLERLHQNPYAVSADKNIPILLYCKMGYQSTLAARLLCEYGYTRVYVLKNESTS